MENSRNSIDARIDRLFDLLEKSAEERIKSNAEHDAKLAKERADFDERMKKLEKQIGGIGNNNGLIAEEYFFNSFENGQKNFFSEKFDDMNKVQDTIIIVKCY